LQLAILLEKEVATCCLGVNSSFLCDLSASLSLPFWKVRNSCFLNFHFSFIMGAIIGLIWKCTPFVSECKTYFDLKMQDLQVFTNG
jgi:hypothetical protein